MHAHISKFEEHFIRIEQKASIATNDSPAYMRGLKLFLSDSEDKAHLLLRTLPTSMSNIVDNLQTKDGLTYSDIRTKLLDLSSTISAGSARVAAKNKHKKKDQKKKIWPK